MRVRLLIALLVSLLSGSMTPQVVHADAYIYDASVTARVEVVVATAIDSPLSKVNSSSLRPVERLSVVVGTSTTPNPRCDATKWELTKEGSSKILQHNRFGKFYKSASDGTWWVKDTAGHGGSAFKVYRETSKGLEWIADADECGNYIDNKHKGPTGTSIPWSELHS